MTRFYWEVNASRKPFKAYLFACKDTDGTLLDVKQSILLQWWNHFVSILSDGVEDQLTQEVTIPMDQNHQTLMRRFRKQWNA